MLPMEELEADILKYVIAKRGRFTRARDSLKGSLHRLFALCSPPGRAQRAGTAEAQSQSLLLGNSHAECHPQK